jgi:hypothetical protein
VLVVVIVGVVVVFVVVVPLLKHRNRTAYSSLKSKRGRDLTPKRRNNHATQRHVNVTCGPRPAMLKAHAETGQHAA